MRAWFLSCLFLILGAHAQAEPGNCGTVRFADIGWTDVSATTAVTARIVKALGYAPVIDILSVPVAFLSLKNKDVDVFMGNWMPIETVDRAPYLKSGALDVVGATLTGAQYTLAVPQETYDAGLRDFADIAKFKDQLGGKIYGIEPGNDGNRTILGMIKSGKFGLGDFDLVESSEQGMLAQLDRSIRSHQMMVFLGWEPHPMNVRYKIKYLADPSDTFGPSNGAESVFTNVRGGYLSECPNIGALLKNQHFSLAIENTLMSMILTDGKEPSKAAEEWLRANPNTWSPWLAGVTTIDGKPGLPEVEASLGLSLQTDTASGRPILDNANKDGWFAQHKLPLGAWIAALVGLATSHGKAGFDFVSTVLGGLINGLTVVLLFPPLLVMIALFAGGAYALHRSIGLVVFIVAGLLLIADLGYWQAAIETLSLVFSATIICILVGIPLGIAAAHRPVFYQILRPILDLMQTIPTFVYLIPTLVLFGLGAVPGLISTVIFSIPAPIRLTHLGISSVPLPLREAGEAFGATKRQLLFKVELPYAMPTIMAGVTQCIMLCLSMVVIAALVGAEGLGKPVVRALNTVNISMGFEAGLAIVILAIILDRVCKRPVRI
jgi:glycine betaine/proline transport system substrate-binding protein